MGPGFHFPEKSFPLHLLLECAKGLFDIIVANDDLNDVGVSFSRWLVASQAWLMCIYRTRGQLRKGARDLFNPDLNGI